MTNQGKKFSIIVPMHNEEGFIITALRSVASQTFADYECIVIDDHSTDCSKDLVTEFVRQNPNIDIKLRETKEGHWGPGAAKNVGLDNANGEYIVFLDADDELDNDQALQNINNAIQKNDMVEVLLLSFQRTFRDRKDRILRAQFNPAKEKFVDKHYQMKDNLEGVLWNGCWKKSLFDNNNIRCAENAVWDDQVAKLQLFNAADQEKIKVSGVDKSHYIYNIRPGKSIGGTPSIDKLKANISMHRKIAKLVEDGKINKEFEKDIKARVRKGPLLVAAWMLGMKMYSTVHKTIPDFIDRVKGKRKDGDENER